MRKIYNLTLMLGVLIVLSACKEDKPSEESIALSKLSSTWNTMSVTKDGVMMSGYEDFSLTLSGSTLASTFAYATLGRPALSPWPSGGSWTFGANIPSQIIRDAGSIHELVVNYTLVDKQLTLEFNFSGTGYSKGRMNSPAGSWKFIFSKQ